MRLLALGVCVVAMVATTEGWWLRRRRSNAPPPKRYKVEVQVAGDSKAGTDADVYVTLFGNSACERKLNTNWHNDHERGSRRTYEFDCGKDIGPIRYIRMGHRGGQFWRHDDWKLSWVKVYDVYRNKWHTYSCNCWLKGGSAHVDLREPIHGGWSGYGAWASCSKPCGGGTQTRTRSCTNPRPQYGGNHCTGSSVESRPCNSHACPIDGGWSAYGSWGNCSVACGGGTQTRNRTCTNPAPQHGGVECSGNAEESQACNEAPCPIDGGWSDYTAWTACSVSCGGGVRTRSRECNNPAPEHSGANCTGAGQETEACNETPCPTTPAPGCAGENDAGPHSLQCLRDLWMEIGCSVNGTSYPQSPDDNGGWWQTLTVKGVRDDMRWFNVKAERGDASFITKCYGIVPEVTEECGDDSKSGPHSLTCLRQIWLEIGCATSGDSYPMSPNDNGGWWQTLTVGGVRDDMNWFAVKANREDQSFVRKCYGSMAGCNELWEPAPHSAECLQTLFNFVGCTDSGTAYPTDPATANGGYWNTLSGVKVIEDMRFFSNLAKAGWPDYKAMCGI